MLRRHVHAVGIVIAVATLCGCAHRRSDFIPERFSTAISPHFEVMVQGDSRTAQQIAQELEGFRSILSGLVGSSRPPEMGSRTWVYALRRRAFEDFIPAERGGEQTAPALARDGVVFGTRDRTYVLLDLSTLDGSLHRARHGLVHHYLRAHSDFPYPPWYVEGLAELVSNAYFEAGRAVIGIAPAVFVRRLRMGQPMDLRELLAARDLQLGSRERQADFSASAWALVNYLYVGHLVGPPNRQPALSRYLALEAEGAPIEQAALSAFGESTLDLDRSLREFIALPDLPTAKTPIVAAGDEDISSDTPLSATELYTRLGQLALELGRSELSEMLFRRALRGNARDPRALFGLASASSLRRHTSAETFEQATARGTYCDLTRSSELEPVDDFVLRDTDVEVVTTPRLTIASPTPDARIRSLAAWAEVVGQAGFGPPPRVDVAFAVDGTASTRRPASRGESVLDAELFALRRMISLLDPGTARVSIVLFGRGADVVYPLGDTRAALRRLDELQIAPEAGLDRIPSSVATEIGGARDNTLVGARGALFDQSVGDGGADMANALRAAVSELVRVPPRELTERRIMLLSDEDPYYPDDVTARRDVLREADRLSQLRIRLDMYAVGRDSERRERLFSQVAARTRGQFVALSDRSQLDLALGRVRLRGLEAIQLRNLTASLEGRAIRVFENGTYDGFVPLTPGENRIQVLARLDDGEHISATVSVLYDRPDSSTEAERIEARALLERLRSRTIETELLREREELRDVEDRDRQLEIETELERKPQSEFRE